MKLKESFELSRFARLNLRESKGKEFLRVSLHFTTTSSKYDQLAVGSLVPH